MLTRVRPSIAAAAVVATLLLAYTQASRATTPPVTPAPQPTATASSTATSHSSAGSWSEATGGNATANGGQGGSGYATSGGNSLTSTVEAVRQAPSVGQGSLYIPSCGVAGNAGGSRDSGSAFLGFAWTPMDCRYLLLAASYQALGMVDAACESLNATSMAKKLWKGDPPPCAVKAPEPQVIVKEIVKEVPQACPSQPEREKLIMQKCVSK